MSKSMQVFLLGLVSAALGGATIASPANQASNITFKSWEVATEFSWHTNPNDNGVGQFSYGYETSLNASSGFQPLTNPIHQFDPVRGWQRTTDLNDLPSITRNIRNITEGPFGSKFIVFPPHALAMHPGRNCEYADLRFTAPTQGRYLLSGQFYAMDYAAGTTTDVHISKTVAGVARAIYDDHVFFGSRNSASFTPLHLKVSLQANDTIDFQVGCGNGNYLSDTTGLNAVIEQQ